MLTGGWLRRQPKVVHQTAAPASSSVFWLLDELIGQPVADVATVAQLSAWNCLGHLGTICRTCVERCPEPGAIEIHEAVPTVDPDLCTGCGQCAYACPAPAPALRMIERSP